MVSELMSRMKLLTEVKGISNTFPGRGPSETRPRYNMYVLMRPPNNKHSDPKKSHIATLLLDKPVVVVCPCVP